MNNDGISFDWSVKSPNWHWPDWTAHNVTAAIFLSTIILHVGFGNMEWAMLLAAIWYALTFFINPKVNG